MAFHNCVIGYAHQMSLLNILAWMFSEASLLWRHFLRSALDNTGFPLRIFRMITSLVVEPFPEHRSSLPGFFFISAFFWCFGMVVCEYARVFITLIFGSCKHPECDG
jgi:hypothetical protein